MKLLAVLSALLFIGGQHLVMAESRGHSGPHVNDVVFGYFNCNTTTASGVNEGFLRSIFVVSGTIFGAEAQSLGVNVFPDDALQACDDVATLIKAKAESSGCVAANSNQIRSHIGSVTRGFSFTCVGSRSEVVAATGAMGEEFLGFLSSLEGGR